MLNTATQRQPEPSRINGLLQSKDESSKLGPSPARRHVTDDLPDPDRTFYLPGRTALVNKLLDDIFRNLHSTTKTLIFITGRGNPAVQRVLL